MLVLAPRTLLFLFLSAYTLLPPFNKSSQKLPRLVGNNHPSLLSSMALCRHGSNPMSSYSLWAPEWGAGIPPKVL